MRFQLCNFSFMPYPWDPKYGKQLHWTVLYCHRSVLRVPFWLFHYYNVFQYNSLSQRKHLATLGLLNYCRPSVSVLSKGDVCLKLLEVTQHTASTSTPPGHTPSRERLYSFLTVLLLPFSEHDLATIYLYLN